MQTSSLLVLHCQLSSCEILKPFTEKLTLSIWGSILQHQWDLDLAEKMRTKKIGNESEEKTWKIDKSESNIDEEEAILSPVKIWGALGYRYLFNESFVVVRTYRGGHLQGHLCSFNALTIRDNTAFLQ